MGRFRTIEDVRVLVRERRKTLKLTQAQAAGSIGYTQKWLSDFERGTVDPPTSMVLNLLGLLGLDLDATPRPSTFLREDEREIDEEGL